MTTDADLYARGAATLVASWEAYAQGAADAVVERHPGAVVGAFPREPQRGVYNNALLDRGLPATATEDAIDAVEAAYASHGIDRYAIWIHEDERTARAAVERRPYAFDSATRAMGMALADLRVPEPDLDVAPGAWSDYVAFMVRDGLPGGLLTGIDASGWRVALGRADGEVATAGIAFDHYGDCGIYNVGTLDRARRRGLGTAVTARLACEARDRDCTTASLQSTAIAERVYARVGFRDLGRHLEYVPRR